MKNKNDLDTFWDLSELIPPQKENKNPVRKSISTVEMVVSEQQEKSTSENIISPQILSRGQKRELPPTVEYEGFSHFIKKVKILNWKSDCIYYDLFGRHALYYKKLKPHKCEPVHFFSYMPQYSQMNQKQMDWYVWWREQVNNGIYPDTDHPYILLYVFELINLSTEESAARDLDILINLWANYHEIYPQLNQTLGEWICDFSLIYKIPIRFPDKRLTHEMISRVTIPEIFYSFDFSDTGLLAKFLLSYCNSYNYRRSKFYDNTTAPLYEKHILAAFEAVMKKIELGSKIFTESVKSSSKIAFMGALCSSPKTKKRIEISYASIALETDLRVYISDIIKYSENRIRNVVGIRSRLNVKHMDNEAKSILDNYFSSVFGKSSESTLVPEYEKLYDSKAEPFSIETAKTIEQRSWDVTQKLVEAFEEYVETEEIPEEVSSVSISATLPADNATQTATESASDGASSFYKAISKYSELFELIKNEKYPEQINYIKSNKLIFEAVADEINEAAAEIFGDILIEESDIGYKIIDDYKDIIME